MAECSSCKASIVWAETPEGKKQPFDREPNPRGNRVLLGRGANLPPQAVPVTWLRPRTDGDAGPPEWLSGCVYMPHHATCSSVEKHR